MFWRLVKSTLYSLLWFKRSYRNHLSNKIELILFCMDRLYKLLIKLPSVLKYRISIPETCLQWRV